MYAVTSTSYRAISSAADAQSGETAVDTLPEPLLTTLHAAEMRRQRDSLHAACDWTQLTDVPLPAVTKTLWATHRQALRDVPQQAAFPAVITWPTAP